MIIGVDVGTTVTKAVLFADDGTPLRRAAEPTRVDRAGDGRYEQDAGAVFASVEAVLSRLAADSAVQGVGITGQGDGLWLADAAGAPVRPAVSWLDARGAAILATWAADGVLDTLFRRTGTFLFPGAAAPILAALRDTEPATLAAAATAGYCKDLVLQRLTGLRATDPSDASVPFLDPRTGEYADDLLALCGLTPYRHLLAPVHRPPMATLTADAAARTGLPAGLPVVAGPYDLPACAWGGGVTEVGDGLLILGTTLACQVLTDTVDTSGEPAGLTLCTWEPDRWLRAMPAMVGAAALDWTLGLVGAGVGDLPALLAASPTGANGVTVLPFLAEAGERAPFVEPRARARVDGLHLAVTRADVVRATCEAIAYAARHCLTAAGLTGDLVVCGGGTGSPEWLQIFADVLGRPLRALPGDETGARGAALAARRALDLPPWPAPAGTVVSPGPAAPGYEARYKRYLDAIEHARPWWGEHR
ncbi:FGGY-family carbohydrate kinase [Virgisporangium aurantiacum]|uniref:Carbohydrate kinase n=1 Tax=Virgisporangium aurantiacum TaxID=175570 RepID=A0A8J3Z9J7_9ACTN|nr:FGGY-family carbohydrate kinase [Virgisporangium aurantiacum]GIJ57440.1 carbohydrate kinase [Virgisporangium aurantiacum]